MQTCHHCEAHAKCVENVPILANLNQEEKREIIEIASSSSFKKGEMIYMAGDEGGTLFILHTGRVKLSRLNASGKEQVLRFVEPGEFLGELSLFSSLPLSHHAQALEETTMCVLHGKKLKALLEKFPSIAFKIMDELSRRLEKAESRIEDISLSSARKRLVNALLELVEEGQEIILPMTKGDLASQLSMTQESLSRQLAALQEEGLILLKGHRRIIIKNKVELVEISQKE